jgi:hypothetical protein
MNGEMIEIDIIDISIAYMEAWVIFCARCGDWDMANSYMGDLLEELQQVGNKEMKEITIFISEGTV